MESQIANKYKLRSQIKKFYKLADIPAPIITSVNDEVASIFATMVYEAKSCSKKMTFVPSPSTKAITVTWVIKYLATIMWNVNKEDVTNEKCLKATIANYNKPLIMASQGL